MGRKKHVEEGGGSEGWLVSYCDMISLLVTFFLMMMTFSTSSAGDIREVGIGLLKGRGGIFPNLTAYGPPEEVDPSMLEELARELDAMRSADVGETRIGLSPSSDGLSILFDARCSFDPGSARVRDELRDELRRVVAVIGRYEQMIVVEGFTDGQFVASEEFPTAEALSAARAFAAAQVLLAEPTLSTDQVQIAALGAARLRAPEDLEIGRELNRRVELRLLSVTRERALDGSGDPERKRGGSR